MYGSNGASAIERTELQFLCLHGFAGGTSQCWYERERIRRRDCLGHAKGPLLYFVFVRVLLFGAASPGSYGVLSDGGNTIGVIETKRREQKKRTKG